MEGGLIPPLNNAQTVGDLTSEVDKVVFEVDVEDAEEFEGKTAQNKEQEKKGFFE